MTSSRLTSMRMRKQKMQKRSRWNQKKTHTHSAGMRDDDISCVCILSSTVKVRISLTLFVIYRCLISALFLSIFHFVFFFLFSLSSLAQSLGDSQHRFVSLRSAYIFISISNNQRIAKVLNFRFVFNRKRWYRCQQQQTTHFMRKFECLPKSI